MSSIAAPSTPNHDSHGRPIGPALIVATLTSRLPSIFHHHVKPHFTPFNLTVATVVALVTGGFVTLILLMLMVATNFNLLGAIE